MFWSPIICGIGLLISNGLELLFIPLNLSNLLMLSPQGSIKQYLLDSYKYRNGLDHGNFYVLTKIF
jgi:hypothetical protein